MEKDQKLRIWTDSLTEKEAALFNRIINLPREASLRITETVLRYNEVEPEVNEIIEDVIKSTKNG